MTFEDIAAAGRDAADLLPGEAADNPNGLTRRIFGILIGAGTVGAVAGWTIVSATGGTEEVPTSFGAVRIVAAERQARLAGTNPGADASHTPHSGGPPGSSLQPFNHTWGEHLAVKLEVRNTSGRNVLFAAGQLRLMVGESITVTNRAADVLKDVLAAGSSRSYWISYLVPIGANRLAGQFIDPRGDGPLTLALPNISLRPGSLEGDHA
ncbi:hypothetical protein BJ994_000184 [Arthrobacter pigmenti]|uniref:DUF4352 domain-containing protein n=1 Tax=Arthrobacter pigmenti TaxID=271432 RepID=A0A846RDB9_9MICC|nr:hypothetical protein [Arthrobacter pigmenti]NJC21108.1 hypothetical protein [Arthrobacter pigmenti]